MPEAKAIYAYAGWLADNPYMGTLYAESTRGKESFSFEYVDSWLSGPGLSNAFPFDPDLSLFRGRQYAPNGKSLFGMFTDSCPDRWGRVLLKRREALIARKEKRSPRQLVESDFLLGVHDTARTGALRYRLDKTGIFLADGSELSCPPWATLRDLEFASLAFEDDADTQEERWLDLLLAPGSSLGGARPKATVQDSDGSLWIAKFPSRNDEFDSGAWEKTVHDLALLCGLAVPEARLSSFSSFGSTFLIKRFDRSADGRERVHFSSAMALLGKTDGASAEDGSGYADIAAFIRAHGAEPQKDLAELWKRIVFGIAVSNTDDHLRNHGFTLSKNGWCLSPMYDVNPDPWRGSRSLNIGENDNGASVALALKTAPWYGLSAKDARELAVDICHAVQDNWRRIADTCGLSRGAQDRMERAFSADCLDLD